MVDAIAFALCLPLARGKHAHVRDLVYQQNPNGGEPAPQNYGEEQMFVQLNLKDGISLRRSYLVKEQISEYTIIENGRERPCILEEYKSGIEKLNLSIGDFCFYQDKLLTFTKQNLASVFETLSGSAQFREQFDRLKKRKEELEDQIRTISQQLKEKKHEKVKVKGLSEYQKQIEVCISDQKEAHQLLAIVQILLKEKEIQALGEETAQVEESLRATYEKRQECIQAVRGQEQALRRAENQLADREAQLKQTRQALQEKKTANMQSQ